MLLNIDYSSDIPIYLQIRNQIVQGIASGKLKHADHLPTIRALADESGINMMTVSKAYQLLKQEGYINTSRRNGAVVANGPTEKGLSQNNLQLLRLLISEAKIHGLSKEDFLERCSAIYDDKEEEIE